MRKSFFGVFRAAGVTDRSMASALELLTDDERRVVRRTRYHGYATAELAAATWRTLPLGVQPLYAVREHGYM